MTVITYLIVVIDNEEKDMIEKIFDDLYTIDIYWKKKSIE